MTHPISPILPALLATLLWSCSSDSDHDHSTNGSHDHDLEQVDGQPDDHDHDHDHEEISLGDTLVGEWKVQLAQGHGVLSAGEEGHLVVKLPFNDAGATVVRAWIGSADRTLSYVGRGEYAPGHDDYDIHATAPDPLPAGVLWWLEIERPDGTKAVGSAQPEL